MRCEALLYSLGVIVYYGMLILLTHFILIPNFIPEQEDTTSLKYWMGTCTIAMMVGVIPFLLFLAIGFCLSGCRDVANPLGRRTRLEEEEEIAL